MTAWVDLGLMFSFRNTDPRRSFVDVYRDELELIVEAEQLGFDTVWLTEHHFAQDGYSPSIVPIESQPTTASSRRTSRLDAAPTYSSSDDEWPY